MQKNINNNKIIRFNKKYKLNKYYGVVFKTKNKNKK